jgi:hypothetical protein
MARIRMYPDPNLSWNSGSSVEFEVDDGEASLTQGFGGWETIARPQRVALTRFVGNDPIGQSIPILLDGYRTDSDVMPKLDALLSQSRVRADRDLPPTVWRIDGPVFYPGRRWIVVGIEFGDTLRTPSGDSAVLTRQRAVLNLLEYVPPDQIRVRKIRRRMKPKSKKSRVLADGLSIRQLAVKYYGTSRLDVARQLGKSQKPPIRDVRKKLGEKRQIRLPVIKI